jgi:dTDP-4-amino-4,6-dideoxygalactose transaminase
MTVPFLDIQAIHDDVGGALDKAWYDVARSGAFVGGPFVEAFEEEWARYCSARFSVGVANGTDALSLTLEAMGIGAGDEVIVPANTFIATASAVARVGATPVFVDVAPDTLLVTADYVRSAITPRTAAVIVVHLFGQPANMTDIMAVCRRAGIAVVEDAAQAHGARWKDHRVGSLGDAGCFSFYPGKNLGALGDGGAVVTNDEDLAGRIRSLGNHGRGSSKYVHVVAGTNSRLDGLQAALLSAKLPYLDAWNEGRRRAARSYQAHLAQLSMEPVFVDPLAESVHHLLVIRSAHRDQILEGLGDAGIGCGIHYPVPCHLQEAFADRPTERLPVAEQAAREIVSLPMWPQITQQEVDVVVERMDFVLEQVKEVPSVA